MPSPVGLHGKASAHTVPHTRSWVRIPSMLIYTCASTWIKKDWLRCQEVSRCDIRGGSEEFIAHTWLRMQARYIPWFWNPGQTLSKVHNRGISSPTKRTDDFPKLLSKLVMKTKYQKLCWFKIFRFCISVPKTKNPNFMVFKTID